MSSNTRRSKLPQCWFAAIGLVGTIVIAPCIRADDGTTRAEEMKRLVQPLQGFKVETHKRIPVELSREPLVRWSDPTRKNSDGSLWAVGKSGRPVAIVAVELYPQHKLGEVWTHEFVSLSTGLIEVDGGTGFETPDIEGSSSQASRHFLWTPKEPGVTFHEITGAPGPGASEAKRLRQMKELAERFTGSEYYDPAKQTYSLRLSPHPIHRYRDAAEGIVDGVIFQITHGTNPEILLLVEAQGQDPATATWRWAAARLTTAEPTLRLDQKVVWTVSTPKRAAMTNVYCGAIKPRDAVIGGTEKRTRD